MRATVEEIKNKIKVNDWISLQTLFDKFNKQLDKVHTPNPLSQTPTNRETPNLRPRTLNCKSHNIKSLTLNPKS